MSSISPDALDLAESLSRILNSKIEVDLDEARELTLVSDESRTADEHRLLNQIEDLLHRDVESRTTIARLDEELRIANENNEKLARKNRALSEMVTRDLLTGLYTRWFVKSKIDEEMQRSKRQEVPISVLMVDIDHFKTVNDSFGHLAGDAVLREMGRLIRESLRTYDIPGRYGGEEFCLLLPATSVDSTMNVAERLRARIEENLLTVPEGQISITASIGVAGFSDVPRIERAEELIGLADQALYRAKTDGRNRVELWTEH